MIIEGNKNELQQNEDWKIAKMGRFSSSQHHRLMADAKREMTPDELANRPPKSTAKTIVDPVLLSTGAITYIEECISEKLTGMPAKEEFTNYAMQWGIDNEPIAANIYASVFGSELTETGYIPYMENYGGSPDRLVDQDGGIEIKCPSRPVHLKYKLMKTVADLKEIAPEYYWQILGYLIITDRKWFDFVSYNPYYPGKYQMVRLRVHRVDVLSDIQLSLIKIISATEKLNLILNSI